LSPLQIGVFADNLKLPLQDGIRMAAQLGAASFQMYTTSGEVLPERMTRAARSAFCQFYEGLGLRLSAICADFGHGFVDSERNAMLIPQMRDQVDLAVDLGTNIITTHIGTVPAEKDATWETLRHALTEIGGYAAGKGVVLATETGPEPGPALAELLQTLDTDAVRVNFDPANLTYMGFDLDEALDALLPYIVHTHAKDALRGPGPYRERPLGEGDVPWAHYIGRLQAAGYRGAFTIEREEGPDPIGDVRTAIAFLKRFAGG
jgi:sugar phosphate isomerase/epimerase